MKIKFFIIMYWFISLSLNSKLLALVLRPHQEKVINYMSNNREQKGLILYHSPGSGKSLIALTLIQKSCPKKSYIIAPNYLKSTWHTHIEQDFINIEKCITILSYEEASNLNILLFKDTLVIVDEAHNIVTKIKGGNLIEKKLYLSLFQKLKQAKKILLLTATPIINSIDDLSYLYNLAIGEDIFTYNRLMFRKKYMNIDKTKSFVRGYFFESKFFAYFVPFWTGEIIAASLAPLISLNYLSVFIQVVSSFLGSLFLEEVVQSFPIQEMKFRYFSGEFFKEKSLKYLSYYKDKIKKSNKDFPSYKIKYKSIKYSLPQYKFYLKLNDKLLDKKDLLLLIENELSQEELKTINFLQEDTQEQLIRKKGFGRQIGNITFIEEDRLVIPDKFKQILKHLDKGQQSVIYSNYYEKGIKELAKFLDTKSHKNKYKILHPNLSTEEQRHLIADYNNGKYKILLLHPNITEGVTLKATRQMHILEPVFNNQILKQIVGRVVRYQSHIHLKKEEQEVEVFVWKSTVVADKLNSEHTYESRKNWQKYYLEVNPSETTRGIYDIDPNYRRKLISPDDIVYYSINQIESDISAYNTLVKKHSIESM
jgi:superfamily II DNA or RNA helicase